MMSNQTATVRRIDYIEWACSSPQCDYDVIIRDHTPFVNPISRRINSYAKPVHCACGAPAVEREVLVDGTVTEYPV